jgi:hypothetical protein
MYNKLNEFRILLLVFLLAIVLQGCSSKPKATENLPVARVLDQYLYQADLQGVFPSGLSPEDSSSMARDFIEKWIRNQLMLNKAEINLSDAEKDVEQQINSYRSSLLIYAYEQSYLRQNLDTLVTDTEIEAYYKENKSNFVMGNTLIKGLFIKVPDTAQELYKVRQWYRSDEPESIKALEGYCFRYASVFDHFNDGWITLNEVLGMMPASAVQQESALLSRRYYEGRDSAFYYFLHLKEIAASGTVSPLDIVKNDVHSIILNKRKIKLINELETSIYSDAQNHEHFNIYK